MQNGTYHHFDLPMAFQRPQRLHSYRLQYANLNITDSMSEQQVTNNNHRTLDLQGRKPSTVEQPFNARFRSCTPI